MRANTEHHGYYAITGDTVDDSILTAPLTGWLSRLDAVPDTAFATGLVGDGLAIDPTSSVLHAPCPATVVALHEAGHAITLRGTDGFELLLHVGIDTVAQGGRGFRALVRPGDTVARGAALLAFDLDGLVRNAPAIITPIILTDSQRYQLIDARADGAVAVGEPIGRVNPRAGQIAAIAKAPATTLVRDITIALVHGIHARPAARLVATARAHAATGYIRHGERRASLVSLVELMSLGISRSLTVRAEASGPDAEALIEAVAAVLGEQEQAHHTTAVRASTANAWGMPVGVCAAPGMAIGPAHWWRDAALVYKEVGVSQTAERTRVANALTQAASDLDQLAALSGARGAVSAAQRALLDDPDLHTRIDAALLDGRSAPAAIRTALSAQIALLRSVGDARIAERAADLEDIARRLISATLGRTETTRALPDGAVLLTDELLPSQFIALDSSKLAAICLKGGGPTSHVAILAAGAGVPMLVAAGTSLDGIADTMALIVDADQGTLGIDPDTAMLDAARTELQARAQRESAAGKLAIGRTADGVTIPVLANLGAVADASVAAARGAEGCGLLRTEFLFIDRDSAPDAVEQTAQYQAIADALGTRPLVIRLLDVGGDKPAPYLQLAAEENPALGLRGIRIALAHPQVLETQLRAILAVQPAGRCRIMLPMVSSVQELRTVRALLLQLCAAMSVPAPPLGIMVETPAAAIACDLFGRDADFFSIGSNDLTQYTLAMDRGNAAVAAGIDGLHPAVLRLIAAACEGAARHARPVSVCGGLAAEALAVPILIGLGVRTLSVPPTRIAAIRALLADLTLDHCVAHARAALTQDGPDSVRALARTFAQQHRL